MSKLPSFLSRVLAFGIFFFGAQLTKTLFLNESLSMWFFGAFFVFNFFVFVAIKLLQPHSKLVSLLVSVTVLAMLFSTVFLVVIQEVSLENVLSMKYLASSSTACLTLTQLAFLIMLEKKK